MSLAPSPKGCKNLNTFCCCLHWLGELWHRSWSPRPSASGHWTAFPGTCKIPENSPGIKSTYFIHMLKKSFQNYIFTTSFICCGEQCLRRLISKMKRLFFLLSQMLCRAARINYLQVQTSLFRISIVSMETRRWARARLMSDLKSPRTWLMPRSGERWLGVSYY